MTNKIVDIPKEFRGLFKNLWREAAIYGGRFSLKSHTVARYLLIEARQAKKRVACFREFQNSIAESSHQLLADLIRQYELSEFEVTNNSIINKLNGSDFLFRGLWQNEQSIKSIEGIDLAWVEEAQTVSQGRLMEDDPVHVRLVQEGRPNTLIINVNYDIAIKYGWMPDSVRLEMEDDKARRPALFRHKWLGEPNSLEQRIFTNWQIIDDIPHEARLERYGLDFGYTNDPSAIVALYYYNGGYILDELCFQKGLSNKQLADIILMQPRKVLTIADSAEPKSIDEIRSFGVNILPCEKGRDSVRQRIQMAQDQRMSVTKRSTNILKEYRNYLWLTDKDGRIINEPDHLWSHCFAPETLVETTKGKRRIDELVGEEGYLHTRDGKIARFYDVKPTRNNAEVVSLTFDDGDTLTVTPDHLLLLPTGEWIEAGLLRPSDMIQSSTYAPRVLWLHFLQVQGQQVLQGLREWKAVLASPLCLGNRTWAYSGTSPRSPHRPESSQQSYLQSRIETQNSASARSHDSRETATATRMGRHNSSSSNQVAWIGRGDRVSQVTWQEKLGQSKTLFQNLSGLLRRFFNAWQRSVLCAGLLPPMVTKTVTANTRGFRRVTYNLEVEGTHCLMANGVIAHNSMDAFMYALATVVPMIRRKELLDLLPRLEHRAKPNPAR